jgi:hypothetical protein
VSELVEHERDLHAGRSRRATTLRRSAAIAAVPFRGPPHQPENHRENDKRHDDRGDEDRDERCLVVREHRDGASAPPGGADIEQLDEILVVCSDAPDRLGRVDTAERPRRHMLD